MKNLRISCTILLVGISLHVLAQDTITNKKGSKYAFDLIKRYDATPIENQNNTGTCWSFSTLSYFESELMRMGKGELSLSEMYIVRKAYEGKAENYVRMHGMHNFGAGGAFHDIPWVIQRYGIVPLEAYKGLSYGTEEHNHDELDGILTATVKVVKDNPQKTLTPSWKKAIGGVLDAYLGQEPTEFTFKGKKYTPRSYADELGLNMDDYVAITSYTHHPFYSKFVLEIPDNWAFGSCYNVPLDELIQVMEHAIENGYTFAWGADVSEDGFAFREGLAILPKDNATIKKSGKDSKHFNDAGAEKISNAFEEPVEQRWVSQEERQEAFDNYETTDDHGMHVTGLVKDQLGHKYFIVKNSWGLKHNDCDGYFYASEAYARYKTMNIFLHKDALPKETKKKLGIK
ncbi:MAG: C1 family peptidase [Flavobacteriales bacterium]|nr:C1 family peptidase [Flavobacteriales bacterium]